MVRLMSVGKSFGATAAVADLDLESPKSGVLALIGPSGCGKSTALRLMAGLESPDQGEVLLGDSRVSGIPHGERASRIGYVIQEGGLFPHLTARANAVLPARFAPSAVRLSRAEADRRVRKLAELVHLTPAQLDRFPKELSGGQRQRVALVRALVLDPGVLLLDEPLGALDPVIRAELQVELKRLFAELGKSVVLVTHDLAEAAALADEIVILNAGRVAQRGSLADLIREPADDFVRTFVGEQIDRVRALLDGVSS
ncbi:MAG: ATP-binding cassette domain-containing protein [Planctomycetota bacterium]